ncbi:hypothetical protein [Flavobacterium filum]|uniref:hypothetical protein n=1 Tax=Flavobacterium filum TaxID=370974 RepID=UPI0023F4A93B|nr:hypothetical protein [Flavobacterium filum]
MDTLTTIIKKDTVFVIKDTLQNTISERHITTETTTHKGDSDCFMNLCDCKLLSDLLWPLTVLIILFVFKKQFQKIVDSIGDRIKKGAKVKLGRDGIEIGQELSETQQKEKAEEEYKATIKETGTTEQSEQTISKTEFIPKYLGIERRIFEVLLKALYPRYKILSNRKIGIYEYDLIIDTLDNKDYDYVIEVKYYPNANFTKHKLQDIALKLSFMQQDYQRTAGKLAKPALIIVSNKDFDDDIKAEIFKQVNEPFNDKKFIKLLMVKQDDIENLTRNNIIKFLEE